MSKAKLKQVSLEQINAFNKNTLMEQIGIECIELGEDYLIATMPVDHRTHQPMGLLHGGASAALIETIGSMGSTLLIDLKKEVNELMERLNEPPRYPLDFESEEESWQETKS